MDHEHDHVYMHAHGIPHDNGEHHAHDAGHPHEGGADHEHSHGEAHDHPHTHGHTHEHTHADGTTHTHPHDHTHAHPHAHGHGEGHAQGCLGAADCEADCNSCDANPRAEVVALMRYMVGHNAAHANELAQLASRLKALGDEDAYEQVTRAVSDFEKGNLRLSAVLAALDIPKQ